MHERDQPENSFAEDHATAEMHAVEQHACDVDQPNPLLTEPEMPMPNAALAEAGDAAPGTRPAGRNAATFIFLTVTLDMLAVGMIGPIMPRLIEHFVQGDQAAVAHQMGLFATVFAVMQFFFSPVLGSLSDRFGRRPIVLLSNFGLGLDYLLMSWAPGLQWLLLGRIISGLTASSVPTAQAYMSDVTPKEQRAAAFGLLSAAFGVGLVIGPALGGLLGSYNLRLPFLASAILSLINGCYGFFVLPESLKPENRSRFSWKRANPIGSAALLIKSKSMMGLAAILLLGYFAQQSLMNVYVLYAYFRYGWTERAVGLSLGLLGCFTILVGLFVVKRVTKRLGERRAIFFGLCGGMVGYLGFAVAPNGKLFLCVVPLLTLMGVTWPSIQAMMTRYTSPSEQGQLQGAINSLRGISGLGGPEFFTAIFAVAVGQHAWVRLPGLPFFVAAGILVVTLVVAIAVTKDEPKLSVEPA